MELRIQKSTSATFYGAVKLSDLRKFMEACKACSDSATVTFNSYRGDGREPGSTVVSVSDA